MLFRSPFAHLKNTKLNYLDISCNIFDGKITDDIGNITGLIHAYLRNNKFSGNIPSEIGNLKNLKFLDLSHNDINGEIPKSMKQLTGLLDFNAAYTNLSGDLPDFLGIMPNLTFLDLRDCRFTGTIPKNYLRGWWSINLNYNFLTGPVPKNIDNYIPNIFYISQYSVNDSNKEFGICDIGETKNGSSRISKKESCQKERKDDDIKRKEEILATFEERIKSQIRF